MSSLLKERVKETSTTTGTGTLNLDGAVSGFRSFVNAFGSGATVYYMLLSGTSWESGIGVVTSGAPDTLTRSVLDSSAAGALLNLGAGTKTIFCEVIPESIAAPDTRILQSSLPATGTFLLISGTAYYVYVGRTVRRATLAFVEFHVTTVGAGAQTAEVGLFSSPLAPNKAGQTLTKIVADGALDTLSATVAVKRNTASLATIVPADVHLWAAVRTAMATTQPTTAGLSYDQRGGHLLTTTGGGALTGLSTTAGGLITLGTANVAPDLRVTMD